MNPARNRNLVLAAKAALALAPPATTRTAEYRSQLRGANTLAGYAAVYGQRAQIRGGWEQVALGAFDAVLRTNPDVVALRDHDPSMVLGRTTSGTLRLRSDSKGLHYEIDLPETSYARDLRELVARGDVLGASFGFIPGKDELSRGADGAQVRTHTSVARLLDVSIVTLPAYSGTSVDFRRPLAPVAAARSTQLDARTQMILIRHRVHQKAELRALRATEQRRQHEALMQKYANDQRRNHR